MKLKANNSNFEPCPEFTGRAVCVDVTPLKKQQSQFGERDVFKVVFEVDADKEDGSRYCAWSRNFTPTLNEKANFRKFLRSWFGRDLTQNELSEFDTETLIGKPAHLVVVHEHKDGETYANIVACTPEKSAEALKPCGKYIRVKDRQPVSGSNGAGAPGSGGYRRAEQPKSEGGGQRSEVIDHGAVKVHVGKYKGIELRDLNLEAVQALCEKWIPGAKANAKPTADDKRLIAALDWWLSTQAQPADDLNY
ncbi:MAG TPA: hypothetical protein VNT99_07615 [Methylomirabilota bacterium]|nr:hypothetical protein [Methylomirabilota bacterium]